MPTLLNETIDLEAFYHRLATAERCVLMLDYDGTLSPFVVKRDEAVPYPGVRSALSRIIAGGRTRVVIVTGRAVRDVVPLLDIDPLPEIWGSHGWEHRLPTGDYQPPVLPAEARVALEQAIAWGESRGFAPHLEVKPASVAFHWRGMETHRIEELRTEVEQHWGALSRNGTLTLKPFDGGYELGVPGKTKADAVERILHTEAGAIPAAFLGDDRTDEDAFTALAGNGLRVLVRNEVRETSADLWLTPPEELLSFLERWI
jgi:trehalose-phosphatase